MPSLGDKIYDRAYFDHYAQVSATPMGEALNALRCDFVGRHWQGPVVDVGIGSGAFIEAYRSRGLEAFGWDISPWGKAWLFERGLLRDPTVGSPVDTATLWDVIEHVEDWSKLLSHVRRWLFLSLPIFLDSAHVLRSKHFKPGEHCWYFTHDGLVTVMGLLGFDLVEANQAETELGREGIGSYAFCRY